MILVLLNFESSMAQNLIANGTFDSDISGWNNPFVTSEWILTEGGPISGVGSMRVSTSINNNAVFGMNSNSIAVMPGKWYFTSAWFKTPSTSVSERGLYFIEWFDSSDDQIQQDSVDGGLGVDDDVWLPLDGYFKAPENASSMIMRLMLQTGFPGQVDDPFGFWDDVFVLEESIFFNGFD